MSVEAITWAFAQNIKPSGAKFVLVALANYADQSGVVYPTVSRLCELTGQDRKTVMQNITHLKKAGLITDTGLRTGKTESVPVYRLVNTSEVSSTENGIAKPSQKRDDLAVPKTVPLSSPKNGTSTENGTTSKQYRFSAKTEEKKEKEKEKVSPHTPLYKEKEKEKKEGDTKNISSRRSPNSPGASLATQPPNVSNQTWNDFKTLRKAKRAPLTVRALETIESEAKKARMSLEDAMVECCARGWQGFKADWVLKDKKPAPGSNIIEGAAILGIDLPPEFTTGNVYDGELL